MWDMVGADAKSPAIPSELSLAFLRDRLASNRGRARGLRDAAVTFGITRADGRLRFSTIYVTANDVHLEDGPTPIEYTAPTAVVYADEATLDAIMRGERGGPVEVEGERAVLGALEPCLGVTLDPIGVRGWK
jgi:hypothetical protein